MANSKSHMIKSPEVVRTKHGEFYRLKSGRLIPVPPKGGNVSRSEIRAAVHSVLAERKSA